MKKLVLLVFAAMFVACFATDYPSAFKNAFGDDRLEEADSLLRLWEASSPDDPELYPARFNLLLNRAQQSVIELTDDTLPEGVAFILTDSLGNKVGSMAERIVRDDSLYRVAIAEIERGIGAFPDRLDFRLGKAGAASFFGEWNTVYDAIGNVLSCSDCDWRWTNGAVLGDSAESIISNAAFDYARSMYMEGDTAAVAMAAALGRKALVRFPENVELLNLMGGIAFNTGDSKTALGYMSRAFELQPCDGLVRYNMAYVNFVEGDTVAALNICSEIKDSECMSEEAKQSVAELENRIRTPLEPLRLYDYFFKWLPLVASVVPADQAEVFSEPGFANVDMPEKNGYKSPFSNLQIEVTAVDTDDKTMYVWTFPEPEEAPLCLYVAFVTAKDGIRTYMLEKSLLVDWAIGTSSPDAIHSSLDFIDGEVDVARFVKLLTELKVTGQ